MFVKKGSECSQSSIYNGLVSLTVFGKKGTRLRKRFKNIVRKGIRKGKRVEIEHSFKRERQLSWEEDKGKKNNKCDK